MRTIALKDFFQEIGYDWKQDFEKIKHICYYSKSRPDPKAKKFKMSFGMEQPFVLKSIADYFKSKHFFEIGTGRGTACYSIAMSKTIKEIHTIDILKFKEKRVVAVGTKRAIMSNKGIYKQIDVPEKDKIHFHLRKSFVRNKLQDYPKFFDLCFIDGEHDKQDVIMLDFNTCQKIIKKDAIIVFDDYCLDKFGVKGVVDRLLEDSGFNAVLVEFRGHLFDANRKEKNEGIVIMSRRKLL